MDCITALISDTEASKRLDDMLPFVAESKKSPRFQRVMDGLKTIASKTNQLTDSEVDRLQRIRNEMFEAQHISHVKCIDDLEVSSEETIQLAGCLSKHRSSFISGELAVAPKFSIPVYERMDTIAFSGTTGLRIKGDGTRDHTSTRVGVATDSKLLRNIGTMRFRDKERLSNVLKIVNNDTSGDDPFEPYADNLIKIAEARAIRNAKCSETAVKQTSTESKGGSVNWGNFI